MKEISMFQTSDGVLHETVEKATHHADERYGSAVTELAHALIRIERYVDMVAFIERHIDDFVKIASFKQDIILEQDEQD